MQILEHLMLSQGSLLIKPFFLILFWLGDFHLVLHVTTCSSVLINLLLIPSNVLFISVILHFRLVLYCIFYLFIEGFSIAFSSLLIILMTVSLDSFLGKLSISDLFLFFLWSFLISSFGAYSYASPFYLMFYVCSYEMDRITISSSLERVVFVQIVCWIVLADIFGTLCVPLYEGMGPDGAAWWVYVSWAAW